jgi:hypothetical protein
MLYGLLNTLFHGLLNTLFGAACLIVGASWIVIICGLGLLIGPDGGHLTRRASRTMRVMGLAIVSIFAVLAYFVYPHAQHSAVWEGCLTVGFLLPIAGIGIGSTL